MEKMENFLEDDANFEILKIELGSRGVSNWLVVHLPQLWSFYWCFQAHCFKKTSWFIMIQVQLSRLTYPDSDLWIDIGNYREFAICTVSYSTIKYSIIQYHTIQYHTEAFQRPLLVGIVIVFIIWAKNSTMYLTSCFCSIFTSPMYIIICFLSTIMSMYVPVLPVLLAFKKILISSHQYQPERVAKLATTYIDWAVRKWNRNLCHPHV